MGLSLYQLFSYAALQSVRFIFFPIYFPLPLHMEFLLQLWKKTGEIFHSLLFYPFVYNSNRFFSVRNFPKIIIEGDFLYNCSLWKILESFFVLPRYSTIQSCHTSNWSFSEDCLYMHVYESKPEGHGRRGRPFKKMEQ